MKNILNSYNTTELKRFISKTNIKGYSKLRKEELIELMLKNAERFNHIKMKPAKPKKAQPKKVEPKKEQPKKVEPKKEQPKKVEPKKAVKKPVEPKKPNEDSFINEYDTIYASNILSQYNKEMFENIERFLQKKQNKMEKEESDTIYIVIDDFLASGVHFKKPLVNKLYKKYGLKKLFEYTKDLLESINSNLTYFDKVPPKLKSKFINKMLPAKERNNIIYHSNLP